MSARETDRRVVVVGAGQAGHHCAALLRERGHRGPLTLVGDEGVPPYARPPLSKEYLTGRAEESQLWLRPESFYARQAIDRVTGGAVAVDRGAREVRLADGTAVGYDHLVLATGATPRPLPVPGAGLAGVHTLRTLDDARTLRTELARAGRVVVIGAGFVGLEFAAAARTRGLPVTVVEALARPLARAVSAPAAAHFTRLHTEHGSQLLFGHATARLHGGHHGRVTEVELADGRRLPADLVLVGIGATARTELAEAAGLEVDGGIVVDSRLLTGDPRISAVGDCAVVAGGGPRLESVQNAVDHARRVAGRLTGGETAPELPWMWTTQFSTTLQIAGTGHGHDTAIVHGDDPRAHSVLLFRGERLIAVESVNRPADHLAARRLLSAGIALNPRQAVSPGFTLKRHLLARTARPEPVPA